MIKFSIITCTWNSERFLPKTIDSVVAQNGVNLEFVIVDGGSTDSTLSLVSEIRRPTRVLTDVRGGIARAMNAGLEAATGDVVMHLHSDDYILHPGVLERVQRVFERTNCDWLFGRILNDRSGGLFPETYIAPEFSYQALLRSNVVPHAATFVRRSLFERAGGFREDLRFAMDYEMWLRLGRLSTPVQMREALSVFRRPEGRTTEKNRLGSFDEDYEVRRRYLGRDLVARFEHALRYRVRRRRLLATLASQAGTTGQSA